jgi:urease accessory protein
MDSTARTLLRLLHLADTALPVGAAAHSFGLETLAADGSLTPANLYDFLRDYLAEAGVADATLCREAHRTATSTRFDAEWASLCATAAALKPSRESRHAGDVLGRRLLRLVADLEPAPVLERAVASPECSGTGVQYAVAFGLAGGALGIAADAAALALLQQTAATLVSASQRVMPVGQAQAGRILWDLHTSVEAAAAESATAGLAALRCFSPIVDVASMRHPRLATRLFVS